MKEIYFSNQSVILKKISSMNKIYGTLGVSVILLTLFSADISAQTAKQDTTLNRQVYLEREYTPTIQDASKVNTLPALHQIQQKQYDIKFENALPSVGFSSYRVGDTGPGEIKASMDYSKHRGYLNFGAGMYSNLEGALGYRIVDLEDDKLDLFATHSSTNARVKYLLKNSDPEKVKAKDMENFVKLKYSHRFEPLTWYLSGSFLNDGYNYYGNPSVLYSPGGGIYNKENLEKKQSVNLIEVETGIKSKESGSLVYSGDIIYNRFSMKYGPDIAYDGVSANIVNASADIAVPFLNEYRIGAKGGIFYQGADDVKFALTDEDPFHKLAIIKVSPYFAVRSGALSLTLGANLHYAFDINDKTSISPNVKLAWNFEENSVFYLTADGGINDNNLVESFRKNRYFNPAHRIWISQTPVDARIGIKSGAVNGLEFDIFGGYKYTKDEHLFTSVSTTSWANVSDVMYANLGTGHIGGLLKTRLIPYTDLSLKAVTYFYNLKEYTETDFPPTEKKAWGLPALTLDFNADFSFIDNMTLSAGYFFAGGRKTYINAASEKMDAINELNFKASYSFYNWLSVYVKANNVLNQKYEKYYGYTLQGINVLGGVQLKF